MARRVSDELIERIAQAIEELDILEVIKEKIRWEVVRILNLRPGGRDTDLAYMIGLGLPIPGTEDYTMSFLPLQDDAYAEVSRLVRSLYDRAQQEVDAMHQARSTAMNGHKTQAGLIVP